MDQERGDGGNAVGFEKGKDCGGGEGEGEFELDEIVVDMECGGEGHCPLRNEVNGVMECGAAEAGIAEKVDEEKVIDHCGDDEEGPLLEGRVEEGEGKVGF